MNSYWMEVERIIREEAGRKSKEVSSIKNF